MALAGSSSTELITGSGVGLPATSVHGDAGPSRASGPEHLDPARLRDARPKRARGLRAGHPRLPRLAHAASTDRSLGVRDRLSIMAESDVAQWLDPDAVGADSFDLFEAVSGRAVVYFELEADSRPLLARMLGMAIVIDLQTTVATLQRRPTPTLVVIDEFSALAVEQVTRLFGRARSAGMSLLLGTQELSDLRLRGRETVLEQVLGNLSALIAHRQVVPDSAEPVARLAGDRGAWKTSHSSDGRWNRTRARAPLVPAELVRNLPDGCAGVIDLSGESAVRVARMLASAPRSDARPAPAVRLAGRALRAVARALKRRIDETTVPPRGAPRRSRPLNARRPRPDSSRSCAGRDRSERSARRRSPSAWM